MAIHGSGLATSRVRLVVSGQRMSLGSISQQFLREVEAVTGRPVQVQADEQLQAPLLARVQMARGAVPLHRVTYHPNARAMVDYLIAFQCSFVLRTYALPPSERFDLTDTAESHADSLAWVRSFPPSASLPADRQSAFADFLKTSLMSMLRSIPVGIRIDFDLRTRFPGLQDAQGQALRRQVATHAALLKPDIQRTVPEIPLRLNLGMNAAFAKFWGAEFHEPGWTLPYLAAGVLGKGEALLTYLEALGVGPAHDRALIQSWADELGLGHWLRWKPHSH